MTVDQLAVVQMVCQYMEENKGLPSLQVFKALYSSDNRSY